jgi:hypothetical protein
MPYKNRHLTMSMFLPLNGEQQFLKFSGIDDGLTAA